jgi:hypothetical protein
MRQAELFRELTSIPINKVVDIKFTSFVKKFIWILDKFPLEYSKTASLIRTNIFWQDANLMGETPAIAHQATRRIAQDAVRIHAIFLETHTLKVVSNWSYKEELSFSNIT